MCLIERVWKIRGLVDEGILKHDKAMIEEAKEQLFLCYNHLIQTTGASRSFNTGYWNDEEKHKDKCRNVNKLILNMTAIHDKYVNANKEVDITFGEEPKSIITTLWVARAMLDDVLNKSTKFKFKSKQRELLEIMESVQQAIENCRSEASNPYVYNDKERKFLCELRMQILEIREELFGDQQLVQGFAYHSRNY